MPVRSIRLKLRTLSAILRSAASGRVVKSVWFLTTTGEKVNLYIRRPTMDEAMAMPGPEHYEFAYIHLRAACVIGWSGFEASNGEPIPFSHRNLDAVLSLDSVLEDAVDHYLTSLQPID